MAPLAAAALEIGRGFDLEPVAGGDRVERRAGLELVENIGRLGLSAARRSRRRASAARPASLTSSSVRSCGRRDAGDVIPDIAAVGFDRDRCRRRHRRRMPALTTSARMRQIDRPACRRDRGRNGRRSKVTSGSFSPSAPPRSSEQPPARSSSILSWMSCTWVLARSSAMSLRNLRRDLGERLGHCRLDLEHGQRSRRRTGLGPAR